MTTACARCGSALAPGVLLCACETPAAGADEGALAICAGCGIVADAKMSACRLCATPYPRPPLHAVPQPGDGYWAAVRVTFTCNMCRFDVPLNHYEAGDAVVCPRCGLEQHYAATNWSKLVQLAHEVADLGRDRALLARVDASWATELDSLGWVVAGPMRVTLGNPLCPACKAPVVTAESSAQSLLVGCSRCTERRRYARFSQLACAGVVTDENEEGQREALVSGEGDVTVLRCPNCSGPLEGVTAGDAVTTCTYCHVACRVSARNHLRAGHKDVSTRTWWLYFDRPTLRKLQALEEAKRAAERAAWIASHPGPPYVPSGGPSRGASWGGHGSAASVPALLSYASSVLLGGLTIAAFGFAGTDALDETTAWVGLITCICVGALLAWASMSLAYRVIRKSGQVGNDFFSTWWLPIVLPAVGSLVALQRAVALFVDSSRRDDDRALVGRAGLPLAVFHLTFGPYILIAHFTILAFAVAK